MPQPTQRQWISTAVLGLVMFAGDYGCLFYAEKVRALRPGCGHCRDHPCLGTGCRVAICPHPTANCEITRGDHVGHRGGGPADHPRRLAQRRLRRVGVRSAAGHILLGRGNRRQPAYGIAPPDHHECRLADGLGWPVFFCCSPPPRANSAASPPWPSSGTGTSRSPWPISSCSRRSWRSVLMCG